MSTTTTPKPSSPLLSRLPKNKRRLFFIIFAVVALLLAANGIARAYQHYTLLHQDMMQAQMVFSQYRDSIENRLNYNEGVKLAQLEEVWLRSEAKISYQQETIKKLEQALAQKSHPNLDMNLLQELKAQKEMYLQSQQKIQSYEQLLLALNQEIKANREQNQLIKQEQAKMRNEHQELIKKLSQTQVPSQVSVEALEKALESRLSQFVYADYELEQKVKDLQKAVESSAKVGELKALEVYYDDKIDSLSDIVKNSGKKAIPQTQPGKESEVSQLKQELIKLHMEKEEMKTAVNNLWNQQRKNEERLNRLVETQTIQNNKPQVQEQPKVNRPTKVNNVPQKEAHQKASMTEEDLLEELFKQFGVKANVETPSAEQQQQQQKQQNHFNQRRVNPSLNNLGRHNIGFVNRHPGMGHFNHDPFHQFSSFPSHRQRRVNHGMMDDFMFW